MTSRKKHAPEDFETMATTLAITAPYGDRARHGERAHEVTAAVSGALPTERVRELYGAAVRWDDDERFASVRDSNLAEFDAWLAQHDAEVRTATLSAALGVEEMARIISLHRHGSQVAWDEDRRTAYVLRTALLGGSA